MSEITLEQMYGMQSELDARIIKEKGLEGQDLLPNTVLALQVEIGELANEWRGFKHWSHDQKPRTDSELFCTLCEGSGLTDVDYDKQRSCTACSGSGTKNPLLEEFVDCLHFFLSIALQIGLTADDLYVPDDELEGETVTIFTELIHCVGMIEEHKILIIPPKDIDQHRRGFFRAALAMFYELGEQRLGFSYEQIAAAYVAKNQVNHERQSNGY